MLIGAPMGLIAGSQFKANAVLYSAAGQGIYTRVFTGSTSSYVGTFSQFVKFANTSGAAYWLGVNSTLYSLVSIFRNTSNKLEVVLKGSGGTTTLRYVSSNDFAADGLWHHLAISWNTNAGPFQKTMQVYLDGSLLSGSFTDNSTAFDLKWATEATGYSYLEQYGDPGNASFAETYLNIANNIDLSTGLSKFWSAAGKPVFLGENGELPTGLQPLVYLKGASADRTTNGGYGGNFAYSAAPSDTTGP